MYKFVVTGAAGFIGLNTCQYLLKMGHSVLGIDNFSTSCLSISIPVLAELREKYPTSFQFIELDLREPSTVIEDYKPAYIIHLAAIPSVARSVEDPFRSIQTNVMTTTNVAKAAVACGVKKLVYAGSSSYYGGLLSSGPDVDAGDRLPLCKSPYAASKAAGEMILKSFYYTYKLPVVVLRYFNVFGPYQNPKTEYSAVIPAFVSKLLNDESPIIYGNGEQTRDFTFVKNIAHANFLGCVRKASGRTFDIGCENSTSLLVLLSKIQSIMSTNKKAIFEPMRAGDVMYSKANLRYLQKDYWVDLGYKPLISIDAGLVEAIDYYTKMAKEKL